MTEASIFVVLAGVVCRYGRIRCARSSVWIERRFPKPQAAGSSPAGRISSNYIAQNRAVERAEQTNNEEQALIVFHAVYCSTDPLLEKFMAAI